jgi:hypothetical protein
MKRYILRKLFVESNPTIKLSAPWGKEAICTIVSERMNQADNSNSQELLVTLEADNTSQFGSQSSELHNLNLTNSNIQNGFIMHRTRVHETYIREQARNKRLGLILSSVLILSAALIVMFAPEGREKMSYWVGASLVIFSASAGGFGRVWGKAANISFGADQDRRAL